MIIAFNENLISSEIADIAIDTNMYDALQLIQAAQLSYT